HTRHTPSQEDHTEKTHHLTSDTTHCSLLIVEGNRPREGTFCSDTTTLRALACSLGPKRDGDIPLGRPRIGVEAYKQLTARRKREISLAPQGKDEIYARSWCSL